MYKMKSFKWEVDKLTFWWFSSLCPSSSSPGVPELSTESSEQLCCHCLEAVCCLLDTQDNKRMTQSEVKGTTTPL